MITSVFINRMILGRKVNIDNLRWSSLRIVDSAIIKSTVLGRKFSITEICMS